MVSMYSVKNKALGLVGWFLGRRFAKVGVLSFMERLENCCKRLRLRHNVCPWPRSSEVVCSVQV